MHICKKCGVELEDDLNTCPLCGKGLGMDETAVKSQGSVASDVIISHRKQRRKHFWELAGIIAVSGMIACTSVDILIIKGLRWSLFADISIFTAWAILTAISKFFSRPAVMLSVITFAVMVMLLVFDLLTPASDWFLKLGLPLLLTFVIIVAGVSALNLLIKFRGFNLLAIILASAAVYCIISEVIIDKYVWGKPDIKWSLIVAASIGPIALVLLFIHYRMKKGEQLDSFFHV